MKVEFYCSSGTNIHSTRREEFDTYDLGFTDEEWLKLSEQKKQEEADEWAYDFLEIGFIEK